jgi:hypothetical protein
MSAKLTYADGVELEILDEGRNGILFEGDAGHLFVNRGTIAGQSVDRLDEQPLSREQFTLYDHDNLSRPERSGKLDSIINHMGNFFDCVRSRAQPISDVYSQHRSATVCHLANISTHLSRRPTIPGQQEMPRNRDICGRGFVNHLAHMRSCVRWCLISLGE